MIQQYEVIVAWMQAKFGVVLTAERQEGQGLVEYALIIALVAILCVASLTALKGAIVSTFSTITATL
jgi:pilus assembly protein Flp/PilA